MVWRAIRWPTAGLQVVCVAVALVLLPVSGATQHLGLPSSAILTISSDRMYVESAFGQRVAREVEAESEILAAENRRIETELTAEELDLTQRRAEMEPKEFRVLADAFDLKVQGIRRTQDAKARALVQKNEQGRIEFLQAARPVLADLMRETGAAVVLERSSVFLSANAIDMTDLAIERLDAIIGDGKTTPNK